MRDDPAMVARRCGGRRGAVQRMFTTASAE